MNDEAEANISLIDSDWAMEAYTGVRLAPTHDEIARLAFSFYESRGRQDGHEIEDWLSAEQELVRHYA